MLRATGHARMVNSSRADHLSVCVGPETNVRRSRAAQPGNYRAAR